MYVDAPDTLKRSLCLDERLRGRVVCAVSPDCYLLRLRGRNLMVQTNLRIEPGVTLMLQVRELYPLLRLSVQQGNLPSNRQLEPPFSILT